MRYNRSRYAVTEIFGDRSTVAEFAYEQAYDGGVSFIFETIFPLGSETLFYSNVSGICPQGYVLVEVAFFSDDYSDVLYIPSDVLQRIRG